MNEEIFKGLDDFTKQMIVESIQRVADMIRIEKVSVVEAMKRQAQYLDKNRNQTAIEFLNSQIKAIPEETTNDQITQ